MKKTIIQSSALAIICLLAVSSKSFAQEKEKVTPEKPCKEIIKEHTDKIDVGIVTHEVKVIERQIVCPPQRRRK